MIAAITAVTLSGCGPTFTAPDVVGMRLDDAHRAFEALGVDKFEDVDVVGDDRTAFFDRNWVVLKQVPAAGTKKVDEDETIRLEIGAVEDDGILERLPEGSPVAVELQREADAEAADRAAEAEVEEEAAKALAAEEALIGTRPASEWAMPDRDGCAAPEVDAEIEWEARDVADVENDEVDTRWLVDDVSIEVTNISDYEIEVSDLYLRVHRPQNPVPASYQRGMSFESSVTSYFDAISIGPDETAENSGFLYANASEWYRDWVRLVAPQPPRHTAHVGWQYADSDVRRDCVVIPSRSHTVGNGETPTGVVSARFVRQGLRVLVRVCAEDRARVLDVSEYYAKNERDERVDAVATDRAKLPVARNSCRSTFIYLPGVKDSTWALRRYVDGWELPIQWFLDDL